MTVNSGRRTRLSAARGQLADQLQPHGRTERLPLADCDGRVLAATLTASEDVPPAALAAIDGYAVRASDTFAASGRGSAMLRVRPESTTRTARPQDGTTGVTTDAGETPDADGTGDSDAGETPDAADTLARETVAEIDAGERLPGGADAVIAPETADRIRGTVELFDPVTAGTNVTSAGETVTAGATLATAGSRLRPSQLGYCRIAGVTRLPVAERPTVRVVSVGEAAGAPVVARLADRWGGQSTEADDDPTDGTIRTAGADCVVVVGDTDAVRATGEALVGQLAVEPGRDTALATVNDTPVVATASDPVAALTAAVGLVRPAIQTLDGRDPTPTPGRRARLDGKIHSTPGIRTFVPVTCESPGLNRSSGADAGSVANADSVANPDSVANADSTTGANSAANADSVATPDSAADADSAANADSAVDADSIADSGSTLPTARPLTTTPGPQAAAASDGWVAVPEASEGMPPDQPVVVRAWEVDS